jgi:hypothetical protein
MTNAGSATVAALVALARTDDRLAVHVDGVAVQTLLPFTGFSGLGGTGWAAMTPYMATDASSAPREESQSHREHQKQQPEQVLANNSPSTPAKT